MRTPVMAGNWKMNNTWAESVVLAQAISNRSDNAWDDSVEVVVCPATVNIKAVNSVFEFDHTPVSIGAQNVHWEPSGAYTGEVSIKMISEAGATYCIIGHSERREYFGETDEMVNLKATALLEAGLTPIICVGESLTVRDADMYIDYVSKQVQAALAGLDEAQIAKSIIAYEPIWAIGTGRTALPEQAQEVCAAIRACVAELAGAEAAEKIRVLYGGSMKPANVDGLMAQPDIDGGLIGGASLDADSFTELVKACI